MVINEIHVSAELPEKWIEEEDIFYMFLQ